MSQVPWIINKIDIFKCVAARVESSKATYTAGVFRKKKIAYGKRRRKATSPCGLDNEWEVLGGKKHEEKKIAATLLM